jgi:type I restriction-modification system DNA methylase subunit
MPAAFERDDPRYFKILERYGKREPGKPHPADHFAHALGAIILEMQKDNQAGVTRDHLGEIYETEGAAEKEMAQYFTPMPLCEFMAQMIIDDQAPENARIAELTCQNGVSPNVT